MKNETDIIASDSDAVAESLDTKTTEALLRHPSPEPDPEQVEFDKYEAAMLERLDGMQNGDFDNTYYQPRY